MNKVALKPFSVWPPDRENVYRYESYDAAEAYAKKSLRRLISDEGTIPPGGVKIEHHGVPIAVCKLAVDGRVIVDVLDPDGRFV